MRTRTFAALAAALAGGAGVAVVTESASGVNASHEYNHVLAIVLSGQQGDRNGFGSFSAVISGTKLCYGIETVGIRPLAAHIHKGAKGVEGPIVATLAPTNGKATPPTTGGGCVTLTKALAGALVAHPERYYVNVHTQKFPSSAIRGQLAHPPKG